MIDMDITLAKTAGFCFGVKNAIDGAENELKNSKLGYTYKYI